MLLGLEGLAPSTYWSKVAPKASLEASVMRARGADGSGKFRVMAFSRRDLASSYDFWTLLLLFQMASKDDFFGISHVAS